MSSTRDLVSAAISAAVNSSVSLPCSWMEASTADRRSSSSRRYCRRSASIRSWPSSRLPVASLRYRAMNGTVAPSSSSRTAAATRTSSTASSSARRAFTDFTVDLSGTRRLYRPRRRRWVSRPSAVSQLLIADPHTGEDRCVRADLFLDGAWRMTHLSMASRGCRESGDGSVPGVSDQLGSRT